MSQEARQSQTADSPPIEAASEAADTLRQEEAEEAPERGEPVAAGRAALGEQLRRRACAHLDSLCAQAEELRRDFPDFDLAEALRDPRVGAAEIALRKPDAVPEALAEVRIVRRRGRAAR